MRALDDILIGFFIFFTIDRLIRLISNGVIEPWAEKRTGNRNIVENWKLATELLFLLIALGIVYYFRKPLGRLTT